MRMTLVTMMLAMVAAGPAAVADAATAFDEIIGHYESIRQALIKDTSAGVAEQARAISEAAATLADGVTPDRAGVPADAADSVRALLPDVVKRADELAAAKDVKQARAAFSELTKPLVRWQALVEGSRPVVVYCPMEKKSWLQPDEPIGNPYAPSMLRCGEIVAR